MKERWEVRNESGFKEREAPTRAQAIHAIHVRALAGDRLVHVRTYRVEVVYAWRHANDSDERAPVLWWGRGHSDGECWMGTKSRRTIFTDPLGKHSRRRAKAAALAVKP